MLGRPCLVALLTQNCEFSTGLGLKMCCTFFKQVRVCEILNTLLDCDRKFTAWRPIPTRLFKKCYIGASGCMFVHVMSIAVLSKLMKCATKLNFCLLRRPCSHKSRMIAPVSVRDFIFEFSMTSLMNYKALKNIDDCSMSNRCACTGFNTLENPSSNKTSSRQWNTNVTLSWLQINVFC